MCCPVTGVCSTYVWSDYVSCLFCPHGPKRRQPSARLGPSRRWFRTAVPRPLPPQVSQRAAVGRQVTSVSPPGRRPTRRTRPPDFFLDLTSALLTWVRPDLFCCLLPVRCKLLAVVNGHKVVLVCVEFLLQCIVARLNICPSVNC